MLPLLYVYVQLDETERNETVGGITCVNSGYSTPKIES